MKFWTSGLECSVLMANALGFIKCSWSSSWKQNGAPEGAKQRPETKPLLYAQSRDDICNIYFDIVNCSWSGPRQKMLARQATLISFTVIVIPPRVQGRLTRSAQI